MRECQKNNWKYVLFYRSLNSKSLSFGHLLGLDTNFENHNIKTTGNGFLLMDEEAANSKHGF